MSAGAPVISSYETNAGNVHPIRIQPETLTLTVGSVDPAVVNTPTADPINREVTAYASYRRTRYGVNGRQVRFQFASGSTPAGYEPGSTISYVGLTQAFLNAANATGATGTVDLGSGPVNVEFVGVTNEAVN